MKIVVASLGGRLVPNFAWEVPVEKPVLQKNVDYYDQEQRGAEVPVYLHDDEKDDSAFHHLPEMYMDAASQRSAEDGLQEVMVNSSSGLGSLPVCYEENWPQNHLVHMGERYMESISACRYSLGEWPEEQECLETELGTGQGPQDDKRQPECLARFE